METLDGKLLFSLREEQMNPHEHELEKSRKLERNEAREALKRPDHRGPDERPRDRSNAADEIDRDRDGLPDEPAKYRVPS